MSEDDRELNQYLLRICWLSWIRAIVIASNITSFPGKKIGDITPQIMCFINHNFDLSKNQVMLVEHYPISSLHEDLYLHVLCVDDKAIKYEISKDELTKLIGEPAGQK